MDRFFSKLDLRDIRIDPEKNRYLPDDDHSDGAHDGALLDSDLEEAVVAEAELHTEPIQNRDSEYVAQAGYEAVDSREHAHRHELNDDIGVLSDVLKVSAKSRPSAVAGAIAGVVREMGRAEVQAIGAGATNQAIKAVAIARDYLQETGIEVICIPAFIDITIDNEDRTAIRLLVEPR